jgi:hypothetical protein
MLSPVGLVALDLTGDVVGRIEATLPLTTADDPEFALVRLARGPLAETRMVPLGGSVRFADCVQFAFTLSEIERAPAPEEADWGVGLEDVARAYW